MANFIIRTNCEKRNFSDRNATQFKCLAYFWIKVFYKLYLLLYSWMALWELCLYWSFHLKLCLSSHWCSDFCLTKYWKFFCMHFLNSHIMNELIETERLYVEELQSIIEVHVSEINKEMLLQKCIHCKYIVNTCTVQNYYYFFFLEKLMLLFRDDALNCSLTV